MVPRATVACPHRSQFREVYVGGLGVGGSGGDLPPGPATPQDVLAMGPAPSPGVTWLRSVPNLPSPIREERTNDQGLTE